MPTVCPVPLDQQPLNEYQALRTSWFYGWPALDGGQYGRRLAVVWGLGWLVAGPVAAASFDPTRQPLPFLLSGMAGASLLLALLLVRLYLGWRYINQRLLSRTIFYEESGWYDGQTWDKTPEAQVQDRLVSVHQVQPLLTRVAWSLGGLALFYSLDASLWWTLAR